MRFRSWLERSAVVLSLNKVRVKETAAHKYDSAPIMVLIYCCQLTGS